jgi:hypothetical protein
MTRGTILAPVVLAILLVPGVARANKALVWQETGREIPNGSEISLWESFNLEAGKIPPCEVDGTPATLVTNGQSTDSVSGPALPTWFECGSVTVTGGFTSIQFNPQTVTATAIPAISIAEPGGCEYHIGKIEGNYSWTGPEERASWKTAGTAALTKGTPCSAELHLEGFIELFPSSAGSPLLWKSLPDPPTVATGAASSVTPSYATLNATVNPNGGIIAVCRFEYGATASYGSSTSCSASGQSGVGTFPVSGAALVQPSTNYHYRIVATNEGGTSYGADLTFTTPAPPLPKVLVHGHWKFDSLRRATIVRELTMKGVPTGDQIEVFCEGRGCPFARSRSATYVRKGCHGGKCQYHRRLRGPTVRLAPLFSGRRLGAGARICVSIVRPGWIGESFVFPIRRYTEPEVQIGELAPGVSRPQRGC